MYADLSSYAQNLNDYSSQPCINLSSGHEFRGNLRHNNHGIYIRPDAVAVEIGDVILCKGADQYVMVDDKPHMHDGCLRIPIQKFHLFGTLKRAVNGVFQTIAENVPLVNASIDSFITSPRIDARQGDVLDTGNDTFRITGTHRSGMPTLALEVSHMTNNHN